MHLLLWKAPSSFIHQTFIERLLVPDPVLGAGHRVDLQYRCGEASVNATG